MLSYHLDCKKYLENIANIKSFSFMGSKPFFEPKMQLNKWQSVLHHLQQTIKCCLHFEVQVAINDKQSNKVKFVR